MRELNLRLPDAARGDLSAGRVVQRDLAELGEIEHGVLENPVLLPLREVRVVEVAGDRLKNVDVRLNVQADLFGDPPRDVFVAGDDRSPRRIAKREDRDRAVHEQRKNSRGGQQEHEARRDPPQFVDPRRAPARRQSAIVGRMSLPGGATT